MKNFDYRKVSTLEEAFQLLARHGPQARVLAGGTDLLVKMRNNLLRPDLLIDLKSVPGLDEIRFDPADGLSIGTLAAIHRLEVSPLIQEKFGVIAQAAASLGSYQVRCRATLGGNLCNASPAADMIPALISLGAKVKITGKNGERSLLLEDFFAAPGRTSLHPQEILAGVQVPLAPEPTASYYIKHSIRKALDLAIVGVAVTVCLDPGKGHCSGVKIVLGAVGPIPFRAREAENLLRGRKLDEKIISQVALLASDAAQPVTDIRASGEYRREMVRVLTRRVLQQAGENLSGGKTP